MTRGTEYGVRSRLKWHGREDWRLASGAWPSKKTNRSAAAGRTSNKQYNEKTATVDLWTLARHWSVNLAASTCPAVGRIYTSAGRLRGPSAVQTVERPRDSIGFRRQVGAPGGAGVPRTKGRWGPRQSSCCHRSTFCTRVEPWLVPSGGGVAAGLQFSQYCRLPFTLGWLFISNF